MSNYVVSILYITLKSVTDKKKLHVAHR